METKTKLAAIPTAAVHFDTLPDTARVALPVVSLVAGRSPASVRRDVAAGRMPAPIKSGPRATRWIVGDIRRWQRGEYPQAVQSPLPQKRRAKAA
jgi:predicted DNA-binding transcriptional regulator AlpA